MTSPFLSFSINGNPFQLFSVSHFSALVVLVCLATMLFLLRGKCRSRLTNDIIRYTLAAILLLSEICFQLWHYLTDSWSPVYMLPLQLCSVSLLLSIIMLSTKSYRLFEVTYFWGIAGAAQAMLTPELFYPFPHFRFFHFFIAHFGIILACLYMTWVEQFTPSSKSLWKSLGFLNLLLMIALFVNSITGGNYLFVSHKPSNPTLLDYLGPYPWYILSLEVVALLLFYLLYLPFHYKKTRPSSTGMTKGQ